jgi:predicted glutamine amidotransferase
MSAARREHQLAALFTHIRAAIGSAVQQTNCHPFRHNRWLFMHNGYLNEFNTISAT